MALSNSARRKPLTSNELWALFYAAQTQLHSKSMPYRRGALLRAMLKIDEQMSALRRTRIFAAGKRDAKSGHGATYVVDGDQLGSMESITYRRGYDSVVDDKPKRKPS